MGLLPMHGETHARPNDSKTDQDATRGFEGDPLGRGCSKDYAGRCGLSCDLSVQLGRPGHVNPLYKRSPTDIEKEKTIHAQTSTESDTFKLRTKKACSDFSSGGIDVHC